MPDWAQEEGFVQNGDVKLHYYASGPVDGEPVLLYHGFPQFSYMWRFHLPKLAAQGYRVVAPDLRGYAQSDRPQGLENYRTRPLLEDIGAFYKAFGWKSANIVGHDWGGAISWLFAIFYPQLVKRLTIIDVPHPTAFRAALQTPAQIRKSWYIWFFQFEGIAEQVFGDINGLLDFIMFRTSRPGTFPEEDRRVYLGNMSQPGAFAAALNYYRTGTSPENVYTGEPSNFPLLPMPVMLLYGNRDFAFTHEIWQEHAQYCSGSFRKIELEGTSHWAIEEEPEKTCSYILEHLKTLV